MSIVNQRSARQLVGIDHIVVAVVVVWFLLALIGAVLGVFDSGPLPPIALGLAAVLPVVIFGVWYAESAALRQFVLSLDVRFLTVAQTWRVGGLVFLLAYWQGLLPGAFAIPAGLGDMAIGLTAPLVAWMWKRPYPVKTFVLWNALGILDLVVAVTTGVLCSPSPLGVLAGDVTTRLMGQLPLSLIPTFLVPLFVIFHLISLASIARRAA
jgi:hypothetical protein